MTEKYCQYGALIVKEEGEALLKLAESLSSRFDEAVQAMLNVKGRIVVSGMGKSGHIARKIAATMASTGSPAFFVHPAEAAHGDLGMITSDDCVLMFSNSGESAELNGILAYTKHNGIVTIAVTAQINSTMALSSDIVICYPCEGEAGPGRLAPTTSTTLQIAIGDALAMCLMKSKNISANDFHKFHPGGKLGQMLGAEGKNARF